MIQQEAKLNSQNKQSLEIWLEKSAHGEETLTIGNLNTYNSKIKNLNENSQI